MVRLEERRAVAAEAQLYQPVAGGMRVDEGREVVGDPSVHRPLSRTRELCEPDGMTDWIVEDRQMWQVRCASGPGKRRGLFETGGLW